MIDSILANFSVLAEIESTQTIENLVHSLDEEMLIDLKKYLDIWEYMGKYISCQTKPTLCRVWPARHALKNRSFQYLSTRKLQPLRTKFLQLFDDKFTYKPLHKLATFLWPRYRNSRELFTQIDFIIIKREAHRLNNKIKNRNNRNKPILELPKVPEVLDEVLGQYSFQKLTLDQEIIKYQDYLSPVELSLPIFEFWDTVSHRFPLLSSIARRVHIIPVTEVSTERRFNISGQTMSKRRVLLKEKLTDQLTTINDSHDLYDDDALAQAFKDVLNIVDDDPDNEDFFDTE